MPCGEGSCLHGSQGVVCFSWGPTAWGSAPGAPRHLMRVVPAAAFAGQAQAVIMTGPLKTEGMLASTVSQSNMVLTPAAIARVRDRPQHHNPRVALLVGGPPPARHGQG